MRNRIAAPRRPFELKDQHDRFEKKLATAFKAKATDDLGSFEGYGAVFNDPHPTSSWMLDPDWQDVILPGAFASTLAEHKKRGTMPAMLYMHERGNVIGAWRSIAEQNAGLVVDGQTATNARAPSGATFYELLKMGALTGMSIGFRATKVALDEENKLREIVSVELGEISLVDIPGGPSARVTDVKAADLKNPKFLERLLRDAGLSRKEAKALLAKGLDALRDAVADDDDDQRDADPPALQSIDRDLVSSMKGLAASITR